MGDRPKNSLNFWPGAIEALLAERGVEGVFCSFEFSLLDIVTSFWEMARGAPENQKEERR